MKKLFLFLILTQLTFAQSNLLTLFSGDIVYNGTELITNAIDRTLEPTAITITNPTFTGGLTNWTVGIGTVLDSSNSARFTGDASTNSTLFQNLGASLSAKRIVISFQTIGSDVSVDNKASIYRGSASYLPPSGNFYTDNNGSQFRLIGTHKKNFLTGASGTYLGFGLVSGTAGTFWTIDNVSGSFMSNWAWTGNHFIDTSSAYKQANSYSMAVIATGAGNGTTNTLTLASTLFTAVTNGLNYRFQVYAYTSTANTTLTFKLGDIAKTAIVPTTGMSVLNFDFKATASTTGNILLYLDKAATVYIDEISLKSGS